ncbi:MAG: SUMF1/EgtB/PvdO family nonheme iron enzyme, partial [Planctomycetes bacterium]|nr:SUMF1/EgtB/PvdO family nonheme iron enzyme [Planctomycetota bacterium]
MKEKLVLVIIGTILLLTANLHADPFSNPMDFNNDRRVDEEDFATFAAEWLWSAPDPNQWAFIPSGEFLMGDHFNEGYSDEVPVHAVYLDSFYMSHYEVTNQQYCDYLNSAYPGQIKVVGGIVYALTDTGNSYP